jgi:photosystem II stability/assembly factor-like uncharacterized protein
MDLVQSSLPGPVEPRWIMKTHTVYSRPRATPLAPHTLPSLAILLVAILATLAKAESDPLPVPKVTAEPVPRTNVSLLAVTEGDGVWVAVGSNGTLIKSKDGRHWTVQRSCLRGELRWIFFARNRFVVVGATTFLTSSLVDRWALAECPTLVGFGAMAVGPDGFVGVEQNGQLRTSACGRNWRNHGIVVPGRVFGLAWGGNQWVGVGEGGLTVASNDRELWSEAEHVTGADLRGVHYAQGRFVAVGYDATILVSDNGIHWAEVHP